MASQKFKDLRKSILMLAATIAMQIVIEAVGDFHYKDLAKHLILTLMVLAFVHLLDRWYLQREILDQFKQVLEPSILASSHLLSTANASGLRDIYPSRAAARVAILQSLREAQSRVWVLAVSLSNTISLQEIRNSVEERGIDVRVLLLDALRSPAVFRSLIESGPETARKVVQHQRHGNLNEDPYFSTNLYSYFSLAVAQVKRDDYFKPRTRFYAHSPSFWAIVIDDRIFAEPYTFGSSVSSAEQVLGGQLPLLVYDRGLNAKTFDSYASHIHRLWITSETDLYNVRSRETDRQRIMQEMFEKRGRWLTEVCHMLHTPKRNNRGELLPVETDQRRSPRRRCEHEQQFTIKWRDDKKQPRSIVTRVVDSSYHGLRLSTSAGSPPPETEVEIIGQGRGTLAAAEAMIGQMFERPRSWKVARLVPVNERITSNEEFAIYAEGV